MVLIKVKKRLFFILMAVVLFCSLGLHVYHYMKPYATETSADSDGKGEIEIFDVEKGQVIMRIEPSSKVQKQAESYLNGITGMYVKAKPFPDKGHIIKYP